MIDIKKHINRQFSKACDTYESDAFIQKKMAEHLMSLLCDKSFFKILEIGSGTGYLTSLIVNLLDYNSLFINDLSLNMLEHCKNRFGSKVQGYLLGDAESLLLDDKYSLIISNACFQWFSSLKNAMEKFIKALDKDGEIVFSTFIDGNFKELKATLGVTIDYLDLSAIKSVLTSLNLDYTIECKSVKSHYKTVREMLKSFKNTGVSGLSNTTWTKSKLISFENQYKDLYSDDNGIYLSWELCFVRAKLKN